MSSLRCLTDAERQALETVWALERQLRDARENFERVRSREALRARVQIVSAPEREPCAD